jgi:hypothetical protein
MNLDPAFLPSTIQPVTAYPAQYLTEQSDRRTVNNLQIPDYKPFNRLSEINEWYLDSKL